MDDRRREAEAAREARRGDDRDADAREPEPPRAAAVSVSDASALELRRRLLELEAERAAAKLAGLDDNTTYAADLAADLRECRELYVAAAVTEIALMRAEAFGRQEG